MILPALHEITLSRWVEFYLKYGKELDRRHASIMLMPEGPERADLYMLYEVDCAMQTFSFYSADTLALLHPEGEVLKNIVIGCAQAFAQWNEDLIIAMATLHQPVAFQGELWQMQAIAAEKTVSYYDFMRIQEAAEILVDLDEGNIEKVYDIVAAFFRPVNDKPDSPKRIEEIKQLPLNIGYAVLETIRNANAKQHTAISGSAIE